MVIVTGARGAREVEGKVGDRPLLFFQYGEAHAALVGIDLESAVGKTAWRVGVIDAAGARRDRSGTVMLRAGRFPVERLSLPTGMVDLDPATERRAEDEAARLRALYATTTPERLWQGRFAPPVAGEGKWTGFGARRIINGQPRMPHSGIDYSADRGTPVVASNRGRVALLGEFFFAGRLVALDHGLGLYTLYFHLDGVAVTEGQMVERGQTVGTVGTTGRSSGPHLHFAAQLGRARVNPPDLYTIPVRD